MNAEVAVLQKQVACIHKWKTAYKGFDECQVCGMRREENRRLNSLRGLAYVMG